MDIIDILTNMSDNKNYYIVYISEDDDEEMCCVHFSRLISATTKDQAIHYFAKEFGVNQNEVSAYNIKLIDLTERSQ
jgi:hypothetical protein